MYTAMFNEQQATTHMEIYDANYIITGNTNISTPTNDTSHTHPADTIKHDSSPCKYSESGEQRQELGSGGGQIQTESDQKLQALSIFQRV